MSSNHQQQLRSLWQQYWASDGAQKHRAARAFEDYVSGIDAPDAEAHYLWGLLIYDSASDNAAADSHVYFQKALAQDPSAYMARLYSAHCYHDLGQLDTALEDYLRVDQQALEKDMPIWRLVKLHEQIGYCLWQTGDKAAGRDYFEKVLQAYRRLPNDTLVAVVEAYQCLDNADSLFVSLKDAEAAHFAIDGS
ncbi:MAG: tetratricopeptide repeat protein [Pseudomonadota bacterium]